MNPFVLCINLFILSLGILATPMNWAFPKDHGIHPNYDTEWYYITGHLVDTNDTLHGFQVTFFRHRLKPIQDSVSLWNSSHLYTAHFAFTNGENKSFYHDEGIILGYLKKKQETIIYLKHVGCEQYKEEPVDALCKSGLCNRSLIEKEILYITNYQSLL